MASELERVKATNTPRPEWEMCTSVIDGGAERLKELMHDKSSAQLLELVLNEVVGFSKDGPGPEFFNGLVIIFSPLLFNF